MKIFRGILLLMVLLSAQSQAAVTVYFDEAAYLAALTAHGYAVLHEGFEDDVVWVDSRNSIPSPGSTPSVSYKGILWSSNFPENNISTGDVGGWVVDGTYGLYSNPHGDQNAEWRDSVCDVPDPIPEQCFLHDGIKGTTVSAGTLYGVGGWIDGTSADMTILLDGVDVDLGAGNIFNWTFFGVIDTNGFTSFEFRELDGKGGQAIYIFADDFNIGVSREPTMAWDYCLNIECPDCGDNYTPQQLRINVDTVNSTFNGIVQADDDSFGRAALGVISGSNAYFARWANGSKTQYFYDINLSTLSGTRRASQYDYNASVGYSEQSSRTTNLSITTCPIQ